jgi:hypothetical protein
MGKRQRWRERGWRSLHPADLLNPIMLAQIEQAIEDAAVYGYPHVPPEGSYTIQTDSAIQSDDLPAKRVRGTVVAPKAPQKQA